MCYQKGAYAFFNHATSCYYCSSRDDHDSDQLCLVLIPPVPTEMTDSALGLAVDLWSGNI